MSNSRSVRTALMLAFIVVSSGCGSTGAGAPFGPAAPIAPNGLAAAARDTFIEINDPKGVRGTRGWGIDSQDDIIGSYDDAGKVRHGFFWRDGKFTTIDNPRAGHSKPGQIGPQGTTLYDINVAGDITGRYINSDYEARSFILRHNEFTPVNDPEAARGRGKGTQADGINDEGDVVGDYADEDFNVHGFVLHADSYTTIDAPHAERGRGVGTHAFGINDHGDIVLHTQPLKQIFKGYLLSDGRFMRLSDPHGSLGTFLNGINSAGVIVGGWLDGNNVSHGMIFCDGVFTTHDEPDAGRASGQGTTLAKINGRGDVAGWYSDGNNHDHGFLLHPGHSCAP
jgi:hypothetical protein